MVFVVYGFQDRTLVELEVLICSDCVFWCERCSEPLLAGKKSLNQLASSTVCDKFSRRNGC